MTTLSVYDPAKCCSTGICGTQVNQKLVDLAADLDWLAGLAGCAGLSAPRTEITDKVRELIALGAAIAVSCEPCVTYHIKKGEEIGLTDAQMREAVAVGRMVKEASARNILAMADKLIPEVVMSSGGCGSASRPAPETAKAGGCC